MWRRFYVNLFLTVTWLVCIGADALKPMAQAAPPNPPPPNPSPSKYDYIVVGSGPGGGPLAARLAQAGFSVLLIDAGDDQGNQTIVEVPLFHLQSSEFTPMSWQFFVSHYDDSATAQKDSKFTWRTPSGDLFVGPNPPTGSKPLGIYYPRAAALGGCSQMNAMVTIYPAESDWDNIANITGDSSWSASNMRQFWKKVENNQYVTPITAAGHGFGGWLDVSLPSISLDLKDSKVLSLLSGAAQAVGLGEATFSLLEWLTGTSDLNNNSPSRDSTPGIFQVPLSISNGSKQRATERPLILNTSTALNTNGTKKYKLDILLNTLVTSIIFDTTTNPKIPRATGVKYLSGASTTASPTASGSFMANKEVIISGGTFNTPQLLMLSGIGPKAALTNLKIPVVHDSPAVGTNMQDRYEVSVVGNTTSDFADFAGCTFLSTGPSDPCFVQWVNDTTDHGVYGTNGFTMAVTQKSSVAERNLDLITGGIPGNFHGYFPGYSNFIEADKRHWTWLVLKAHSRNNAGTVTLKTNDPRDMPLINFRSFSVAGSLDLQASYEGVQLARKMLQLAGGFTEQIPGAHIQTEDEVKQFIMNEAWGHHACCTVPIGANDETTHSVLDSNFRVKGVSGLRVVDASVFPSIPSLYIATAIYMISEKAAATIIQEAQK